MVVLSAFMIEKRIGLPLARDKHRRNSKKTRLSRHALSTGPFGIADKAGRTNLTIVNRAVRKDGLVIQPDRPASYIDAMFDGTTTIGRSIWSGKETAF